MNQLSRCPRHNLRGINQDYLEAKALPDASKILPEVAQNIVGQQLSLAEGLAALSSWLKVVGEGDRRLGSWERRLHRSLYFLLFTQRVMQNLSPFIINTQVQAWVNDLCEDHQIYGVRDRLRALFTRDFLYPAVNESMDDDEVGRFFRDSEIYKQGLDASDLSEFKRVAISGFLDSVNAAGAVAKGLSPIDMQDEASRGLAWRRFRSEIFQRAHVHEDVEEVIQEATYFSREKKHMRLVLFDDPTHLNQLHSKLDNHANPQAERSPFKVCGAFGLGGHQALEDKIMRALFDIFMARQQARYS